MVQRADVQHRSAYLSSTFGEQMARRYFGEVVDTLPRYIRGKRKGQLKGILQWEKVVEGGWVKTGAYDHDGMRASGYVERRVGKVIRVDLNLPQWGKESINVASWS